MVRSFDPLPAFCIGAVMGVTASQSPTADNHRSNRWWSGLIVVRDLNHAERPVVVSLAETGSVGVREGLHQSD